MEPIASQAEVTAPEPRSLDLLAGRLEKALCRFDEDISKLRAISDRLLGPAPMPCDEASGQAEVEGCLDELHLRLSHLEQFLDRLGSEINRLEQV